MIEFGKTLREAREQRGLTIAQIAEATRVMSTIIADLENENFSRIAAPIYGRGFVKLYCQQVGLDPKPLIDEFMAIYNGERDLTIRERAPATPEPVPPPPSPEEAVPPPPPARLGGAPAAEPVQDAPSPEPDLFSLPPQPPQQQPVAAPRPFFAPPPAPNVRHAAPHPPSPPPPPPPSAPAEERQPLSRYASPLHEFDRTKLALPKLPELPRNFWRVLVLVVVALAFVALVVFGIRALYRVTSAQHQEPTPAPTASVPVAAPAKKGATPAPTAPAAPRKQQKIPPLYVY